LLCQFKLSIILTILLFLTRPEAWLFIALTPLYFLIKDVSLYGKAQTDITKSINIDNWKKWAISTFILSLVMLMYFVIHLHQFGHALPNTFYIKSGAGFNILIFIQCSIFIAPLFILVFTKRYTKILIVILFLLALVISYSTSSLQMNYADRFAFHVFAPVFFIFLYMSKNASVGSPYIARTSKFDKVFTLESSTALNTISLIMLSIFFVNSTSLGTISLISFYPRALDSHAQLGKTLYALKEESKISSFSFGDAGMTAYHSQLNALDNIGLGSSLVAQNKKVTSEILNLYDPDIVVFHSRLGAIRYKDHSQQVIYDWAKSKSYSKICEIYWRDNYTLTVYSAKQYKQLSALCDSSKASNNIRDREYILENVLIPPFVFWHE
jgi:hypothetical protein